MTDYHVKHAEHAQDYVVDFTFADGTKRTIDLEPFLSHGLFKALRTPSAFGSFRVMYGTIVWPNGADIAPETLYYNLGPPAPVEAEAEA
jgi:hypothetical protein